MTPDHQIARSIFTAAVVDFMLHLMNRPSPMIVGANYPRDQMVKEFEVWAAARNIGTSFIDLKEWKNLYESGLLR